MAAQQLQPREVKIRVHDGVEIAVALYMPEGNGPFPVLFAPSPYRYDNNTLPASPQFLWRETGPIEMYVTRGYVYANMDVRGCGKRQRGHLALRAADGVADAHQRRPLRRSRPAARDHRRRRTLNPEVIEQVKKAWGLQLRDGYGQTETTAQVGNTPGSPVKVGSMGRPLPGVPVVLVDPLTGERVSATDEGPGEGEICLDLTDRPLPLMTGYQGDDERNAEAMAGGFYHTGDVATIDSDGYITYVGRTDDVFKASDYKISPFELESVLIEHPAVAEAAVVPAPDAVRLAVPKAYIVLAPGHEPTEETALSILGYAREHLAPWQRVRRIEFSELPKTISGKIRRVELRGRENDLAAEDGDARPENEWRDDQFPQLRSGG